MITDLTQTVLRGALDAATARQRAIANNLANVETPGYRRQEVDFEARMRAALDAPALGPTQRRREVSEARASAREDNATPDRENGNNVDPEREMSELAQNTIRYHATLQAMEIKGAMVRAAIYEGRR